MPARGRPILLRAGCLGLWLMLECMAGPGRTALLLVQEA